MRRKMIPVLFLAVILAACSGNNPQRRTLDGLNVARDVYNQAQGVLKTLHDNGTITTVVWNSKVVPADNAAHAAIEHAYELLKIWVATGDNQAYNEYALALTEAFKLISLFRDISNAASTGALR